MATTPTYGYQAAKQTTKAPTYVDPTKRKSAPADSLFQTPIFFSEHGQPTNINPSPVAPSRTPVAPKAPSQPADRVPAAAPANTAVSSTASVAPLQLYDYTTDPILQQIQGLSTQDRGNADAGALAVKKQLAVQYGDPALANQIGDSATAAAAAANPYGAFNRLKTTNDQNVKNLDENLNSDNLFYSGARVLQQGQLADQYGQSVADQTANEQQALGATDQNRLAAYMAADQRDQQANSDAESRALQAALMNQQLQTQVNISNSGLDNTDNGTGTDKTIAQILGAGANGNMSLPSTTTGGQFASQNSGVAPLAKALAPTVHGIGDADWAALLNPDLWAPPKKPAPVYGKKPLL